MKTMRHGTVHFLVGEHINKLLNHILPYENRKKNKWKQAKNEKVKKTFVFCFIFHLP